MDHSIFITIAKINGPIVSIFINDIKAIGIKRLGHIKKVKLKLVAAFEIVNIGPISFYIELNVKRD